MRKEGTIVRWDDAKGFGFIRSSAFAQDLFVHVRDFRSANGDAPRAGARVSFAGVHVGGKGPRAVSVQTIGASTASAVQPERKRAHAPPREIKRRQEKPATQSGAWLALPLMGGYGGALTWLVLQGQLAWPILIASVLLNLATFFAYWQDKYAAQQGRRRIKEDILHLWSLAGGWGGAWFAQQVLRHKSTKASFREMYWATIVLHCAVAFGIWWFSRSR